MATKKVLAAENLTFAYDRSDVPALCDVSFSVAAGEAVGIVGANGAGKSTLLKIFPGIIGGYQGTATAGGLPVLPQNFPAIRAAVGYVFQDSDSQLFMETVAEDVAFGPRRQGLSDAEAARRAREALRLTMIEPLAKRQIYRLSGGQKKLAAIAGVLAMRPETILFDEPFAALDPVNRENLIGILNNLPQAKLIAAHDLDFILATCRRVIVLANGRITADGAAGEILTDRALLENSGLRLPRKS